MMRSMWSKALALVVGGLLTATTIACTATPLIEAQSAPTPSVLESSVPMTFGAYTAQLKANVEEDEQGWDCRINGNATCGAVQYELICAMANPSAQDVCALEGTRR